MALLKVGQPMPATDTFPSGLRVLVVDDDPLCLMILERMLRQCSYTVTTCSRAATALSLLRENKDKFDLVISDVYMPDMDGFKLLELIGLELELPVIMMSANGETSAVMKGITHGACDYLLKPVRIEELRNIWQHVVRKKTRETFREENSGDWDETGRSTPLGELEYSSKKRKEKDSGIDDPTEDANSLKKARVVWSIELHQQFVNAVNKLGIDKAVPKRILEIMNVQGLTRENVASHLQKYRLYLKRLSGVQPAPHPVASFQAAGEGSNFGGTMQVQPGGRIVGKLGATNLGAGLVVPGGVSPLNTINRTSLGNVDSGTLATLAQLQALQQRQQSAAALGPLGTGGGSSGGGAGLMSSPSMGLTSSLQGLSPYDLNMLMQAQQESVARQRLENSLGGADNLATMQSLGFLGGASGNASRNSGNGMGGGVSMAGQSPGGGNNGGNNGGGGGGSMGGGSMGGGSMGGGSMGGGSMGGVSMGGGSGLQLGTGAAGVQQSSQGTGVNDDMGNYGNMGSAGEYLGLSGGLSNNDLPAALLNQLMNQGGRSARAKYETSYQS